MGKSKILFESHPVVEETVVSSCVKSGAKQSASPVEDSVTVFTLDRLALMRARARMVHYPNAHLTNFLHNPTCLKLERV